MSCPTKPWRSFRSGVAVAALAGLALSAGAASAQTSRPGNWQGVYIGGHLGGAIGSASGANTSGFTAGAHLGVNGQFDRLIVGVEADVSATSNGNNGFGAKFRQGTNGSMRGRLGYSFDRVMVYGTGGFAVTNYEYRNRIGQISRMRAGTVLGAGAELTLTDNVAVRGEVLHYNYSNISFAGIGGPANVSPTNNVFRGGLNYKF
jgi:outer membrane immunogenic protein